MIRVAWNGVLSDYFLVVNRVKQGGVLSPIIFSVYTVAKKLDPCYILKELQQILINIHNFGRDNKQ